MAVTRRRRRRGEIGVSGNLDKDGYIGDDYLSELDGHSSRAVYDRMRRSDPLIGLTLANLKLPIQKADYQVEPAGDSAQDREIAEFMMQALLENMTWTWDDTLRHVLLMLDFGFSILEKVWVFIDGKWTLRKLAPRLSTSVVRWDFGGPDGRKMIGPIQQDTDGNETTLPIEKLLVFTRDREGDNWEGISILRRIYKPWFIKEQAEKINAISLDRHGAGVPVMKVPRSVKEGTKEYAQVENLLESFAVNEVGYIIEPEGYDFRIEGAGSGNSGEGISPLPTVKHYDETMAKSMLQMFVNLGTAQTGSRSLGSEFIRFFQQAQQAHADYVVEVFNRFLMPEWTALNWEGAEPPRLTVARIEELALESLSELAKAKLITPDLELENTIRREQHLPEIEEAQVVEEEEQAPDTDDDEEEPPDDDQVERDRAEWALAAALPEVAKVQERQACGLAGSLLGGKPIPQMAVPYKREMFEALLGQDAELDDDLVALIVDEMATNLKLVMARSYNLLRRRRPRAYELRAQLFEVATDLPHERMLNAAANYVLNCFPLLRDEKVAG